MAKAPSLHRLMLAGDWIMRERVVPHLVSPIGYLRSHRQTVSIWPRSDAPLGSRVIVFCHFDRAGKVRDYTRDYLAGLAQTGLSIVFVSNSGFLHPESMQFLQRLCGAVLVRQNVGYDFGAWRDCLERMAVPRHDTRMLLLANDSVYGPLRPLHEMIDRIDFGVADVWGATDSWQTQYHLQSFFLAFGPRALGSEAWGAFWAGVRPVPSKKWVIRHYEIGLSQRMIGAGLRLAALWPYVRLVVPESEDEPPDETQVMSRTHRLDAIDPIGQARRLQTSRIYEAAARRLPLNPTSDLWRQLLSSGFPFIKRELLRDNPTGVSDVADWRAAITRDPNTDISAIDVDLKRTLRNRAP